MSSRLAAIAFSLAACVFLSDAALANGRPPANAKRLSDIVKSLEAQGFAPIVEVEFDDGLWEVQAFKDGRRRKIKIDPVSGDTKSDRPDD